MRSPLSITRSILAADGTRIAWHTHESERLPVVCTSGLGTTANIWNGVTRALVADHRVGLWDYRGHGKSENALTGDYAIGTHVDDLTRVTEAMMSSEKRFAAPVHVGFSMGVTVLLELYRRRPELVGAMVLVAGGAGHPYSQSQLLRAPGVRTGLRRFFRRLTPLVPGLAPLIQRATQSSVLFPLATTAGIVRPHASREVLEHFFHSIGLMDPQAFWESLCSLMEAHTTDLLSKVHVPVLVIAPETDIMAPRVELEAMARAIRGSEYLLVPRTGHAIFLEEPELVGERIRAFFSTLSR